MHRAEVIAGIVLLAGALFMIFVVVPAHTETVQDVSVQPSLYPSIALWAIAGFSLLMIGRAAYLLAQGTQSEAPLVLRNAQTLLLVGIVLAIAFVALDYVGFIAGGIGLVGVLMVYMGARNPFTIGAVAVGSTLVIWLFFAILLERPLP